MVATDGTPVRRRASANQPPGGGSRCEWARSPSLRSCWLKRRFTTAEALATRPLEFDSPIPPIYDS